MENPQLQEQLNHLEARLCKLEQRLSRPEKIHGKARLLTTEEAASFLGITVDGLRGLTHKKLIPFYKPNGKNLYFSVDELVSWQRKNHFEAICLD